MTNSANPFDALNNAVKKAATPPKGGFRHEKEVEIVKHALEMLALSPKGRELIAFKNNHNISIGVLKSKNSVDYAPSERTAYISASSGQKADDPALTINLAGALREAMQEHDNTLKKPEISMTQANYNNRFIDKIEDKLVWQTLVVYELGKIANKSEFIDTFAAMGYSNLIESYEKDLTENS